MNDDVPLDALDSPPRSPPRAPQTIWRSPAASMVKASCSDDAEALEALCAGVDVKNIGLPPRDSILYVASTSFSRRCVTLILERDWCTLEEWRRSVYQVIKMDHVEILRLLLKYDHRTVDVLTGRFMLRLALAQGAFACAKYLVELFRVGMSTGETGGPDSTDAHLYYVLTKRSTDGNPTALMQLMNDMYPNFIVSTDSVTLPGEQSHVTEYSLGGGWSCIPNSSGVDKVGYTLKLASEVEIEDHYWLVACAGEESHDMDCTDKLENVVSMKWSGISRVFGGRIRSCRSVRFDVPKSDEDDEFPSKSVNMFIVNPRVVSPVMTEALFDIAQLTTLEGTRVTYQGLTPEFFLALSISCTENHTEMLQRCFKFPNSMKFICSSKWKWSGDELRWALDWLTRHHIEENPSTTALSWVKALVEKKMGTKDSHKMCSSLVYAIIKQRCDEYPTGVAPVTEPLLEAVRVLLEWGDPCFIAEYKLLDGLSTLPRSSCRDSLIQLLVSHGAEPSEQTMTLAQRDGDVHLLHLFTPDMVDATNASCVVCMSRAPVIAFSGCGHMNICMLCSKRLAANTSQMHVPCPTCKTRGRMIKIRVS